MMGWKENRVWVMGWAGLGLPKCEVLCLTAASPLAPQILPPAQVNPFCPPCPTPVHLVSLE